MICSQVVMAILNLDGSFDDKADPPLDTLLWELEELRVLLHQGQPVQCTYSVCIMCILGWSKYRVDHLTGPP